MILIKFVSTSFALLATTTKSQQNIFWKGLKMICLYYIVSIVLGILNT